MPRNCTVCTHKRVVDINADLISGASYRDIAGRYGTSKSTLERHRPHIAKAIAKVDRAAAKRDQSLVEQHEAKAASREAAVAETALDRLMAYHRTIQELLTEARESKDHAGALKAVQAGLKQLELEARLLGELKDHSGAGTGITVQVVYVNANSGRSEDQTPGGDQKQILDVASQKA